MTAVDIDAVLASAATDVLRRFRGYIDREDLMQEGHLWVLSHDRRYREYSADENEKRGRYRLRRDVSGAMEKVARAAKAATLGYDPADEYFYSMRQIVRLLPAAIANDLTPAERDGEGSRNSDPAEGGNYPAQVLDVAHAWRAAPLTEEERAVILLHVDGESDQVIADRLGVTRQRASAIRGRALRALVGSLGGVRPRGCPHDCECHEGPLRRRPGLHSPLSGMNQLAS